MQKAIQDTIKNAQKNIISYLNRKERVVRSIFMGRKSQNSLDKQELKEVDNFLSQNIKTNITAVESVILNALAKFSTTNNISNEIIEENLTNAMFLLSPYKSLTIDAFKNLEKYHNKNTKNIIFINFEYSMNYSIKYELFTKNLINLIVSKLDLYLQDEKRKKTAKLVIYECIKARFDTNYFKFVFLFIFENKENINLPFIRKIDNIIDKTDDLETKIQQCEDPISFFLDFFKIDEIENPINFISEFFELLSLINFCENRSNHQLSINFETKVESFNNIEFI